MQRVHLDDLAGYLVQDGSGWTVLNLAAIAETEERIQIGPNRFYTRMAGEALHPARESLETLRQIQREIGSEVFAAQYQQAPAPPGGGLIKRIWVGRYDVLPQMRSFQIVQSWDCASKDGSTNDWSVCTTWLVSENKFYLLHVLRGRFDYPTLRSKAFAHAKAHNATKVLIEDTVVGTALIQEFRKAAICSVVAVKPERDKLTRMAIQAAKFESGLVFFPRYADWLADLEIELFSFPQGRYDDQVDSISQALAHCTSGYDASMSWV